jgi:type III restriction enzyme
VQQGYVDRQKNITDKYHQDKTEGVLAELPDDLKRYAPQVFALVDTVFSEAALPKPEDGRKPKTNPLNPNFDKKEFKELWARINQKAVYKVDFDSAELIAKCVSALESELRVTPLQYTVQVGQQADDLTAEQLQRGDGFKLGETRTEQGKSIHSRVSYDLLGKIAEGVHLTRKTIAEILSGIQPAVFAQYKQNPEQFISECSRIIKEQKATVIIERLTYDAVDDRHDASIFTAAQTGNDFTRATEKLKKHVFDYAMVDSEVERKFVGDLDTSTEVVVYAKLPRGFLIPTPVGDYNPDWAISFVEGSVKHIYFVAETKGTMSSMQLRPDEKTKIDCARKFFAEISKAGAVNNVRYDVVDSYSKLMDMVARQ